MKREIQHLKNIFDELGKASQRGEILTSRQVSELIDTKIKSPFMDIIIAKKVGGGMGGGGRPGDERAKKGRGRWGGRE